MVARPFLRGCERGGGQVTFGRVALGETKNRFVDVCFFLVGEEF